MVEMGKREVATWRAGLAGRQGHPRGSELTRWDVQERGYASYSCVGHTTVILWSAAHGVDHGMQYAPGTWLDILESPSIHQPRNRAKIRWQRLWIPLSSLEAWAQAAAGAQTDHVASGNHPHVLTLQPNSVIITMVWKGP